MNYTSRKVYEFISKQMNDPIVERKTCVVSGQPFAIFQSDSDFYNKISPTFAGQKFQIPTPTLCPEERQRRRLVFRNERKLYKRKCDYSAKDVISIYSPDKPYKVYDQKIRWSDARDPMDYGFDFDFSKSFTEQFSELLLSVPHFSTINDYTQQINSEYIHLAGPCKNCYILAEASADEDCYYSYMIYNCKNCIDCCFIYDSSFCYSSVHCYNCYNSKYLYNCTNTNNSEYCRDCRDCNFCFDCYNLINKKYHIENKEYTPEEYHRIITTRKNFVNKSNIIQHYNGNQNIHTYGDFVVNCKNTIYGFDGHNLENCKYTMIVRDTKDSQDYSSRGESSFLMYECHNSGRNCSQCLFISNSWDNISNNIFTMLCVGGSKNLFGCIGLKNKSYCIFNKQYTKEDYEQTVAKIITHMQETGERGEFFHPSLSPFGYNETVAQEYFPLTREQALARGYKWQDHNYDPVIPEGAKVVDRKITSEEPLEDEQILKSVFVCEVSGRPYRIIKQELEFYRKQHLPLPRKHPDIRHEERMKLRPGRTLYLRYCDNCTKEVLSVYPYDYQGEVYCEECYQKEVYA